MRVASVFLLSMALVAVSLSPVGLSLAVADDAVSGAEPMREVDKIRAALEIIEKNRAAAVERGDMDLVARYDRLKRAYRILLSSDTATAYPAPRPPVATAVPRAIIRLAPEEEEIVVEESVEAENEAQPPRRGPPPTRAK